MSRKLFYFFIACVAGLVALCVASSFFNSEKNMLLVYDETAITNLNTWTIESTAKNAQIDMADFNPQDTNFEPYSLITNISTAEYKKPVLILESMHQTFSISVNSEIIYEFGQDRSNIFSSPNGGIWHFVELPYIQSDNNIRIDIVPSDDKTSIGLSDLYLAEKSEAFLFLIAKHAVKLLISSIILIVGIILLFAQAFISKGLKNNNLILYLGLLSTIIAIWLISESNLLQFALGDTFVLGHLPYWSIQLLLIPFIFYVDSMYTPSHKSFAKYFCIAFIINFIVTTILHMADIVYYYNTLWVVHLIMLGTFLYFVFSLLYETFAKKNKEASLPLFQISFLVLVALAELAIFYFGDNMNSIGASLQSGMLLYLLTCIVSTSLKLRNIWAESMHTEYLSKIAYSDVLTLLFNRHAFEKDLEEFKHSEDSTKIIITFDLNNLKHFNDNMGHQTGDNYLIFFAELAQKYLSEFGKCYRVGGDEFSAILYNIPFDTLEKRLRVIQDKFKTFDDGNMAGVAVGYAHYDKNDYPNILDYLNHLDECMFKNKTIIKRDLNQDI